MSGPSLPSPSLVPNRSSGQVMSSSASSPVAESVAPSSSASASVDPSSKVTESVAPSSPVAAWLHCCWCRIGLICESLPPAAETLRLNARVAALDERTIALVDIVQRFSRQLEEVDAQLAVLEDQITIANQVVAHRRREGEGPRINAPPQPDERREGRGPASRQRRPSYSASRHRRPSH